MNLTDTIAAFKVKWRVGQVWWPIFGICALHLTHPSAHTQQWTHTHREHTPGAVGSQCCGARGAVGGSVPCSSVSPQSWYLTTHFNVLVNAWLCCAVYEQIFLLSQLFSKNQLNQFTDIKEWFSCEFSWSDCISHQVSNSMICLRPDSDV